MTTTQRDLDLVDVVDSTDNPVETDHLKLTVEWKVPARTDDTKETSIFESLQFKYGPI